MSLACKKKKKKKKEEWIKVSYEYFSVYTYCFYSLKNILLLNTMNKEMDNKNKIISTLKKSWKNKSNNFTLDLPYSAWIQPL
jgi:hypothetical protein